MRDAPASGALGRSISSLGQWVGQALGGRGRQPPAADPWALWQAARAGDQASASALVRRLSPQAYALAMQLLGRREDAEDMVQEAFLRLWRARASDAHGASLATYFNTIVINRCKSWLARRRELSTDPEQLLELADASQGAEPPGADALPPISTAALAAPMARLSPRQRMALAMWAYADADRRLRHSLRQALEQAPDEDQQALQARLLAQWRQQQAAAPAPHGPLAVLQAGWRQHPLLCKSALLALTVAGLLLVKPWVRPDAGMDELLQPDVLSLMTMGEL